MDIVEILIACNSISFKIMQVLSSKPYQGKGWDTVILSYCHPGCLILMGNSILLRLNVF